MLFQILHDRSKACWLLFRIVTQQYLVDCVIQTAEYTEYSDYTPDYYPRLNLQTRASFYYFQDRLNKSTPNQNTGHPNRSSWVHFSLPPRILLPLWNSIRHATPISTTHRAEGDNWKKDNRASSIRACWHFTIDGLIIVSLRATVPRNWRFEPTQPVTLGSSMSIWYFVRMSRWLGGSYVLIADILSFISFPSEIETKFTWTWPHWKNEKIPSRDLMWRPLPCLVTIARLQAECSVRRWTIVTWNPSYPIRKILPSLFFRISQIPRIGLVKHVSSSLFSPSAPISAGDGLVSSIYVGFCQGDYDSWGWTMKEDRPFPFPNNEKNKVNTKYLDDWSIWIGTPNH